MPFPIHIRIKGAQKTTKSDPAKKSKGNSVQTPAAQRFCFFVPPLGVRGLFITLKEIIQQLKTTKFRPATIHDISQIQEVRNSVIENVLINPSKVTDKIVADYLTNRGKGWVCEKGDIIAGFSIVDLKDDNVWALFVKPEFENQKIGKQLHHLMLDWYFARGKQKIWLSTEPHTRAADFYRRQGWRETGTFGDGEIRFEMTVEHWKKSL